MTFFSRHGASDACPVKFLHLNRARTGDRFRPYDLVVVPQDAAEPEHFTVSASGVVHVKPECPSEFIPTAEWMKQSAHFNVISSMCVVAASWTCAPSLLSVSSAPPSATDPTHSVLLLIRSLACVLSHPRFPFLDRRVCGSLCGSVCAYAHLSPYFKNYLVGKSFRLWRSNVRYNMFCRQRNHLSRTLFQVIPSFSPYLVDVSRLISDLDVRASGFNTVAAAVLCCC